MYQCEQQNDTRCSREFHEWIVFEKTENEEGNDCKEFEKCCTDPVLCKYSLNELPVHVAHASTSVQLEFATDIDIRSRSFRSKEIIPFLLPGENRANWVG